MCSRLLTLVLTLAVLAAAPGAQAAFFPGDLLDAGPGVASVEGVDVATDGTGAVAYLRQDGGVEHLFVARLLNGGLTPFERADPGIGEAASSAGIVAVNGGRVIIAWNAGGRVLASARGPRDPGWPAPVTVYDERAAGRTVTNVSLDASIYGVPYIVFTTTGSGGADVRAARASGAQWLVEPGPLDVNPAANAGDDPRKRPDVSASAEGSAFAVWGEDGADGLTHLYGRRLTRRGVASTVREVGVSSLDGRPAGSADSPDVAMEYDSSYAWVVFRQAFNDGGVTRTRALARRLVGSDFDAPVGIDGLAFPAPESADLPRIDIDRRGRGVSTSVRDASFQTVASILRDDVFQPPTRVESLANLAPSYAVPAAGELSRGAVAWEQTAGPGLPSEIRARAFANEVFEPEAVLSRPELGPSAAERGLGAGADRAGDTLVAFLQGPAGDRKLVTAVNDLPPGRPKIKNGNAWTRDPRPKLRWTASFELWGAPRYQLSLAGFPIGETSSTSLRPATAFPDGIHTARIVAIDRRGQQTPGADQSIRIDTTAPVTLLGPLTARKGKPARFSLPVFDFKPGPPGAPQLPGSGVVRARVDFGDRSRPQTKEARRAFSRVTVFHTYRRPGRYTLTLRLVDKAGNTGKISTTVRVK